MTVIPLRRDPRRPRPAPQPGSHRGVSNPNATLDKDGFLKLFIAQLQHQDPIGADGRQRVDAADGVVLDGRADHEHGEHEHEDRRVAEHLFRCRPDRPHGHLHGRQTTQLQTGKVERVATSKDGVATITVAGKAGIDPSTITEVSA